MTKIDFAYVKRSCEVAEAVEARNLSHRLRKAGRTVHAEIVWEKVRAHLKAAAANRGNRPRGMHLQAPNISS